MNLRIGAIIIAILGIGGGTGTCFSKHGQIELNYVAGVIEIIAGLCILFGSIKYHQTATLAYLVVHMLSIVLIATAMFIFMGYTIGILPIGAIIIVVALLSTTIFFTFIFGVVFLVFTKD